MYTSFHFYIYIFVFVILSSACYGCENAENRTQALEAVCTHVNVSLYLFFYHAKISDQCAMTFTWKCNG